MSQMADDKRFQSRYDWTGTLTRRRKQARTAALLGLAVGMACLALAVSFGAKV